MEKVFLEDSVEVCSSWDTIKGYSSGLQLYQSKEPFVLSVKINKSCLELQMLHNLWKIRFLTNTVENYGFLKKSII